MNPAEFYKKLYKENPPKIFINWHSAHAFDFAKKYAENEIEELLHPWYVYIVKCIDDTLYTGISNNVFKRVQTHNKGKGAKYTKFRTPVVLVYSEEMGSRSAAAKEEYKIKKLTRKEKLSLVSEIDKIKNN